jgi:eukaryotic-like serine/threonine-protein kinase
MILAAEPKPISQIQPLSPLAYESLVEACLAKDPDERLQTLHDAKLHLKWIAESDSRTARSAPDVTTGRNWLGVGWLFAGLLA